MPAPRLRCVGFYYVHAVVSRLTNTSQFLELLVCAAGGRTGVAMTTVYYCIWVCVCDIFGVYFEVPHAVVRARARASDCQALVCAKCSRPWYGGVASCCYSLL